MLVNDSCSPRLIELVVMIICVLIWSVFTNIRPVHLWHIEMFTFDESKLFETERKNNFSDDRIKVWN